MRKIAIISDSSSGYKTGDKPNLYIVPLLVNVNNKAKKGELLSYHDQTEITTDEIKELLENDDLVVTTSQPIIGEMMKLVGSIHEQYDEIYVVPVTSTVSGSQNTWNIVAEEFEKVKIVPQHMGGPMLKWMIEGIYELIEKNDCSYEKTVQLAIKLKESVYGILFVSDVKQLSHSGRVNKLITGAISFFNRKVIVTLDEQGMKFYTLSKTFISAIDKAYDYLTTKVENFTDTSIDEIMFIPTYTKDDPEKIQLTMDKILKLFPNYKKKPRIEEMPTALLAHPGNNSLVVMLKLK